MKDYYYQDKYGDVWVLIGYHIVKRLKDGNYGGYFNGQGLKRVNGAK